MLLVYTVTTGFFFSSKEERHDWLQKSLLGEEFPNRAVITFFGFKMSLKINNKGKMKCALQNCNFFLFMS